jgi:hypothetical protein
MTLKLASNNAAQPTANDEARELLRAAIAEEKAARAAADTHRQAVRNATVMLSDARAALERAQEAVSAAKEQAAARLADAAASGTPRSPDDALRRARAKEADCVDDDEMAQAALARLQGDGPEVERRSLMTRNALEAAARAVIAAAVPDLGAYTAQLHRRLEIAREALHFAVGCCKYPPTESDKRWASTAQLGLGLPGIRSDLKNEWREVFQSLQTNADAPLPRLENE